VRCLPQQSVCRSSEITRDHVPQQSVCRSRAGCAAHGTGCERRGVSAHGTGWVQSTDSRSSEIKRDHGTGWVQSTDSRHPTAPFTEGILHPPTDAYSSDDAYSSSLDLSNSGEGCCVTLPNRHEHLAFSKDLANIEYFREISRVRAFTM
jgi:hypothetical protein